MYETLFIDSGVNKISTEADTLKTLSLILSKRVGTELRSLIRKKVERLILKLISCSISLRVKVLCLLFENSS